MKTPRVYEIQADFDSSRHLICESDFDLEKPFMFVRSIDRYTEPMFRYETLEEVLGDEQYLVDIEDGGDLESARLRHESGTGDCVYVRHFSVAPVLSSHARRMLAAVFEATGQLFQVDVEGDEFFIYNCTRLIDAVDSRASELRYVESSLVAGGRRPSQFTKLVFLDDVVKSETLFKVNWPLPDDPDQRADYATIPPPLSLFATQAFVDLVDENNLTGFLFRPVGEDC